MAAPPLVPVSMLTFSRVTLAVAFVSALMVTVFSVFPLLVMTGSGSSFVSPFTWETVWLVSVAVTVISPFPKSQVSARTKLGIKAPSSTRDSNRVMIFFIVDSSLGPK